jgi:hypothetical protein
MTVRPASLLRQGACPLAWVKDFHVSNSGSLRDAWQNVVTLVSAGTAGRAA